MTDPIDRDPERSLPAGIPARLRSVLESRPEVEAAYLFGSRARQEGTRASDYDVAVLRSPGASITLDGLLELTSELSGAAGTDSIDLVDLRSAPLLLGVRILREGKLITGLRSRSRIDFETELMTRYYDLAPFLEVHSRFLWKRAHDRSLGR